MRNDDVAGDDGGEVYIARCRKGAVVDVERLVADGGVREAGPGLDVVPGHPDTVRGVEGHNERGGRLSLRSVSLPSDDASFPSVQPLSRCLNCEYLIYLQHVCLYIHTNIPLL